MTLQKNIDKGKWWDEAWSLVKGCSPVSAGCDHCWSASMSHRFHYGFTNVAGMFNGKVRLQEDQFKKPMEVKKPTTFAVWNDLFHEDVPDEFVRTAFDVMARCPQHRFVVLTKRPGRMAAVISPDKIEPGTILCGRPGEACLTPLSPKVLPLDNVILGTTIENQAMAYLRIPEIMKLSTTGWKTCLSIEPMLESVSLGLYLVPAVQYIDWVIVGSESGPKRRLCKIEWVCDIVNQCKQTDTPVFVKQLEINGRVSHDMNEWPEDLRVREFNR